MAQLGITDDIGDKAFEAGQLADAANLGDPGSTVDGKFVPDWIPAFKNTIHGVIIISGESDLTVAATHAVVSGIFNIGAHNATLHETLTIRGVVRPDLESGHEQ